VIRTNVLCARFECALLEYRLPTGRMTSIRHSRGSDSFRQGRIYPTGLCARTHIKSPIAFRVDATKQAIFSRVRVKPRPVVVLTWIADAPIR